MLSEIYDKQNFTKKDVHEHLEKIFFSNIQPLHSFYNIFVKALMIECYDTVLRCPLLPLDLFVVFFCPIKFVFIEPIDSCVLE